MLLHCNWYFVTVVNGHMLICAEIFMRGLSACIFDIHQPDVVALKARLTKDGKSNADIKALPSKYFRDRYVCISLYTVYLAAVAAASGPQHQSPVMAVASAAEAKAAVVSAAVSVPQEQSGTGQKHLLATCKGKANSAQTPLSAASRFLAAASLHEPTRKVPASMTALFTGDLCQVMLANQEV